MVNRGIRSRSGRRQATRLNNGSTTFANGGQEYIAVPSFIIDEGFHVLTVNGGIAVVSVHGWAMVTPDKQVFNAGNRFTGFAGDLRQRTVVVQTQHGGKVFFGQIRCRLHGDVGIGVGGVADDQHFYITFGDFVQGCALNGENRAVGFE